MKIQCDVCERAEAALLCCADEAALCWNCDEKVHAANKLAGKHQRVPLLAPSTSSFSAAADAPQMPTCDICQEKVGYFFCLEDRALLCRNCDVGIHTASAHGSSHRRFLITGIRVALQHYLNNSNSNNNTSSNSNNNNNNNSSNNNDKSNSSSSNGYSSKHVISQQSNSCITNKKLWSTPTNLSVDQEDGLGAQWTWNEVFDGTEFDQCYGISEPGSSS